MRLLNTTSLEVEEFLQSQVPEYVILSHTWREEEVTLQDLLLGVAPSKKGFAKLTGCCEKAKNDGFRYCWIDTCCIDKTSSAELSEAINSMYQWYKDAHICYAYLEDLHGDPKLDNYEALASLDGSHGDGPCRSLLRRKLWSFMMHFGWTLGHVVASKND